MRHRLFFVEGLPEVVNPLLVLFLFKKGGVGHSLRPAVVPTTVNVSLMWNSKPKMTGLAYIAMSLWVKVRYLTSANLLLSVCFQLVVGSLSESPAVCFPVLALDSHRSWWWL